jgi:hypothetical protein
MRSAAGAGCAVVMTDLLSNRDDAMQHQNLGTSSGRGLRGPAWRWQRAELMAAAPAGRVSIELDEVTQQARDYLRRQDQGAAHGAAQPRAYIAAAQALQEDEARRNSAMILTLGNCPIDEIAKRLKTDPTTLATWETLFFDVREAHSSWVYSKVIVPEELRGNRELVAHLRLACAGPVMARAILDAGPYVPLAEGGRLFDLRLRLALKLEAAAALPTGSERERLFFMKQHFQLQWQDDRLRLAEEKLRQRCEEALAKQRVAAARARIKHERAEAREQQREVQRRAARHHRYRIARLLAQRAHDAKQKATTSLLSQLPWAPPARETFRADVA